MSIYTNAGQPYGGGSFAGIGSLEPATLKARLANYRRNVAKRYRVVTPDYINDRIADENDLYISTKVDGELWFLCKLRGEVALCSPTGRVLEKIPLLLEAEAQLAAAGDFVAAGELFVVKRNGRPRVMDVARALGDGGEAPKLGLKVFDLVSEGDEDAQKRPYADRYARLETLFGEGKRVALVNTVRGSVTEVVTRFEEWVQSGKFEGLVVRAESVTYKVKPTLDIDAVILGFGEHRTGDVSDVRELLVGLLRADGGFQVLGTVANGLRDADKVGWFQRLERMVVPSQFRMANSEGTLCQWVRPEIVVELRCSELLDSDSQDAPLRRMVLSYDPEKGWDTREIRPFVSLMFPVFVRERTDKQVDPIFVGLEQITAIVPLDGRDARPVGVPASTARVLARRAWAKGGKGGTAVRKALLIQTNRGEGSPAFVAHFTDFSAGRKEPLQTTLRVASSREKGEAAVEAWVAENIKKGWEERG